MLSNSLTLIVETEAGYQGQWVKLFLPYETDSKATATIADADGCLLKKLHLSTGHNAIDLSAFNSRSVFIKIDTPFETVLKEIQLD